MIYEFEAMWIIPIILTPFFLGLLTGIRIAKQKITMKLLEKMGIEEFEKLMEN